MRNSHPEHDQLSIEHLVHNTVVTHAQASKPEVFSFQRALLERVLAEAIDGTHNPQPILLRNARQIPGRAPLNPNRVVYA
jgi:hypothetical protein